MIASRLLRHGLLSAAIFSGAACAVGLGEITLHSRIGEALRADVPVLTGGESLNAACFSLGPVANADFPVISAARTRLVRIGPDYRLIITGSKAIDEPVLVISLRAGCGLDLQREYVLLPAPPQAATVNDIEPPSAVAAPMPREVPRSRWSAEGFSETWAADSDSPNRPVAKPRQARTPKPKAPLTRDTLAGISSGKDRVVLGAALDGLPPPSPNDTLAFANELDERFLKMETTLHLLNQEVDKLSTAVSLGAESRAMREKLQDMQAQQATPGLLPSAQAAMEEAPSRTKASRDGWLELLFGLLLGGSVSAGVALLVSRKQDKARTIDAPPPHIAKPRKPRRRPAKA